MNIYYFRVFCRVKMKHVKTGNDRLKSIYNYIKVWYAASRGRDLLPRRYTYIIGKGYIYQNDVCAMLLW